MRSDYLISPSPVDRGARRIVSEDSFHRVAPLAPSVHVFAQREDATESGFVEGPAQEADCLLEPLEVSSLRADERKAIEEGDDRRPDLGVG